MMTIIYKIRAILAGILFLMGCFLSNANIKNENSKDLKEKKYLEIRTALEAEEITLEEAQKLWKKYQIETKERLK
jgi:hypothetical protein|tara:strand:+ start:398 stop:622 length:225 start_codon:yes stop_codon:yes gene_type:complete